MANESEIFENQSHGNAKGEDYQSKLKESYQKLEEMQAVFAASRMGSWSVYLQEGQEPRMKADDMMLELLGLANKNLTQKEVYAEWFSNVAPGAMQTVLDCVERVKKGDRAEATYLWKHPILGERYVRCGGTAKPTAEGYVLRGYFYDVDDEVREQKKKEEALAKQAAIIDTLSRSFRNVFVANLKDGKARAIRLAESYKVKVVRDIEGTDFDFDAVVDRWSRETVHPDDKERMKAALNIQNLRKVLSEQEELVGNYRNIEDGVVHHYQYNFRRIGDSENVVAGFRIIDSLIEEQEAKQKRERELIEAEQKRLQTINAIGQAYSSIYVAYLDTQEIETIKDIEPEVNFHNISPVSNEQKLEYMKGYVAEPYLKENIAFTDLNTVADRLVGQRSLSYIFQKTDGSWMQSLIVPQRYDRDGKVDMILLANRDVTEEKNKEIKQQEILKNQLGIIQSLSNEYVTLYLLDCASGNWSVFKTAESDITKSVFYQVMDHEKYDDAMRVYVEKFVAEEDQQEILSHSKLENLISETPDIGIYSQFYDRIWKGERRHWQVNTAKFTTDEGKVYIVMGFRDVHDAVEKQERQNEQLAQALTMAQQANKAKTTFLNSMSHDIRTPMNAIIGFTALAKTHIDDKEKVEDYLGKISTSSTHLLSLINDILDMSRIESGSVKLEEKEVHIPDLLHDLKTMIQGQVNAKNQNLFIDTRDVIHEDVLTDKLRLNQVLLNIASNAVKFTPPGGDIIIRMIEKPCSLKNYTTYEFSVKDTGIGMSQEFIGHIFETFAREHSSTVSGIQGTGLGMAITKHIVDMMGGEIQVESQVGKGSRFTVTLNLRLANAPVKDEPTSALLDTGAGMKAYDYSDKHVLLVEDNELNREIATTILEETGMKIDSACDGDEAVAIIANAPADEYDLILMDIQMPKMDGYTATREIRTLADNKKANIPIVAMTANAFDEDRKKAFEAGMDGHIIKPIDIDAIAKVLDEIFAEKKV